MGILASILAGLLLGLLRLKFPRATDRKFVVAMISPVRYLRHRRRGREPLAVIDRLFEAWGAKDEAAYRDCWRADATRIVGEYRAEPRNLDRIMAAFQESCAKYVSIRVDYVTKESIEVAPDRTKAAVEVRYGFTVERHDGLVVRERGRDGYGLLLERGKWAVASNWDRSDVS
ncbi:MAG: DUF4440 domain-containing protein [Actinomycetota bacterium]|nr:DUF4440 domain-containing protein [Actinomycetota bacterium]